ncbi:transport protein [Companilactobacillus paralimentarius DSM 13238 = JCM 10415]|uniref:Transport protein n=2 Tax=Companilactobacillus paralimentarius TaxID=83526 RepID=A0A0R1PP77_9LACO|nr:MFS transporter [Companilactobacillus paralimentarius]KAE9565428.1 MFS transporter [Companilactobacillus paralimentarius]KRL31498.1 transport protein [Companilactobacillus paralimentarius DSM 13238 = JCM 10415]QFR70684.1 MFS transporter [Companilactobacillus paralimentarius]
MVIGTAWLFDAADVALLSFIMPLIKKEWFLNDNQIGLVSSITTVGMMFGAILFGYLADKFGKKNIIVITLLIFSVSNLVLALTTNVEQFMFVRFITGIGLGGELPVATTIIADSFSGHRRSKMLILVDSFWAIGWILASLLAFLFMPLYGWRFTVIATSIMALYTLVIRRHLPEQTNIKNKRLNLRIALNQIWSKKYRRATVCLSLLWFIIMFTYYGMFLWLPSVLIKRGFSVVHSFGYTLIMSFAQLPGYFLAAYLMGKLSRKKVLGIYLVGTIIGSFLFGTAQNVFMVVFSSCLLSFFTLGAWGILIALTPTQYPMNIRGVGIGFTQSIGRIGATIGPYLIGFSLSINLNISTIFSYFVGSLIIGILILVFGMVDNDQKNIQIEN